MKFLVNFTLLKYVKSQRSYGFLITKELIFGFQMLDLKDHFSASLMLCFCYKTVMFLEIYETKLSAAFVYLMLCFCHKTVTFLEIYETTLSAALAY